jgi:hypothetical protein
MLGNEYRIVRTHQSLENMALIRNPPSQLTIHGNSTLATLIPSLNLSSILAAYKKNFEYLKEKGYKPKLNIMDNQAAKVIEAYLTPQQVGLQLVEPHNHHINAAKRAIQTFKKAIHWCVRNN